MENAKTSNRQKQNRKYPREIADWLKLPNSNNYTGHSFWRTSATILSDAGANMTELKRHGGWKSAQVAEGYIEDSIENKRRIAKRITTAIGNNYEGLVPAKNTKVDVNQSTSISSNIEQKSITLNINFN